MLYSRRMIRPLCSIVAARRTNTKDLPACWLKGLLALALLAAGNAHADLSTSMQAGLWYSFSVLQQCCTEAGSFSGNKAW